MSDIRGEIEALTARQLELEIALEKDRCEKNLYPFAIRAFEVLEPGKNFDPGWHIEYLCEHLELVSDGFIRWLIINMPPRHMKSLLVSAIWPVWHWRRTAETRFIFSSYAMGLGIFQAQKRRKLIQSDWFNMSWPNAVSIRSDENQKTVIENSKMGFFKTTSTDSMIGGQGADIIVSDDPQNPEKAASKVDRVSANSHVKYLFGTRFDDPRKGRGVLCMQRIHNEDAASELKKDLEENGEDICHITIPAVAEKDETLVFPKSGKVIHRKEGDLLWPSRFGMKEIERIRTTLGPYGAAAQLQQRPTPEGGGVVKREWFRRFQGHAQVQFKGWFLDTAVKDKQENDYTAAALVGMGRQGFYVIRMVRKRIQAALLEDFIKDLWAMEKANVLSIEDKTSGQRAIQYFQNNLKLPVHAYKPQGDKSYRLSLCTPLVAAGKVWLPESAPWVFDFLEELDQFPRGSHDDQVDAFTHAIIYFTVLNNYGSMADMPTDLGTTIAPSLRSGDAW